MKKPTREDYTDLLLLVTATLGVLLVLIAFWFMIDQRYGLASALVTIGFILVGVGLKEFNDDA